MANPNRKISINIFVDEGRRSATVCQALYQGAHIKCEARLMNVSRYDGKPDTDVAAFYGLRGRLLNVFNDYVAAGKKAVLVDLGYWGRHDGGRLSGYHKFTVNDHSPLEYFQKRAHGPDRVNRFQIKLKPMKTKGKHILLAGMSGKGAGVFGYGPGEFERKMVEEIRKVTDRPIIYRPKPSWKDAEPIPGTIYSFEEMSIEAELKRSYAVVTHHSNVAIDALIAGVPAFVMGKSVASPLCRNNIASIEDPYYPEDRERQQLINDIAYCQWNIQEMHVGKPWQHMINEGII